MRRIDILSELAQSEKDASLSNGTKLEKKSHEIRQNARVRDNAGYEVTYNETKRPFWN